MPIQPKPYNTPTNLLGIVMSKGELKKVMGGLLHKKSKRVVTGIVRAGRRTDIMTVGRIGRYIRYRTPSTSDCQDIALLPTIKSAIMHSAGGKLEIKKRDYKEKVRRRKISSLICIVMDTSSSMVTHSRIMAIKSALRELMLDAYQKRDRISVVACFGRGADIVVPFTSSVDKGQAYIERVQYGGTTPLAAGMRKGLEALQSKLRIEKDTRPLLVIVTDGTANVPIMPGADVRGEIKGTSLAIGEAAVPALIIDVSEDGSQLARDVAKDSGGYYYHALPPEEALGSKSVDDLMHFDDVLQALMGALVNPDIRGILLRGADPKIVADVMKYLDDLSLEIKANAGCDVGCSPDHPEDYCHACKLRYIDSGHVDDPSKEVPTSLWTYPIVALPKAGGVRDLIGEIYIRFIVVPGLIGKAHRGMLYAGKLPDMDGKLLKATAALLKRGFYELEKDGNRMRFPARFTLVAVAEPGYEPPAHMADIIDAVVDVGAGDDLYASARTLTYRKGYDVDPARFESQLDRQRKESIMQVIKARKMVPGMKTGSYSEEVVWTIASRYSTNPDFISKVNKLAKTFAAKRIRSQVDDLDIANALVALKPLWEMDGTGGKTAQFMNIARSVAENEVLKEKLLLAFASPELVRGLMLSGFSTDAVRNALRYVQDMGFEVDVVKGCKFLCDPDDAEGYCAFCRIKADSGQMERVRMKMPVINIPHTASRDRLKGKVFVHYMLTPNLLTRAHRGVVFVENVDELPSEAAESIAEVMAVARNYVEGEDSGIDIPCRFTIIATLGSQDGEVHPMLLEHMSALVRYDELDALRISVRAERYARVFSESPETFAKVSEAEKAATVEQLEAARKALARSTLNESQLDMTARMCAELGAGGNTAELGIQNVARVIASLRGEGRVDDVDILNAVKLVLPLYGTGQGEKAEAEASLRGLVAQNGN
jgi:Mg-chelatase subunit ChlI/Mg-chelatase subunit ChlD